MKNMTQKNQNSSFDTKTGSRILRIIGATKLAVSPSISSYKREGPHASAVPPPPQFDPNVYAKNVIDVF